MPNAGMLFVGDTPHDKTAADAANAECVFVAGGHIDAAKLAELGAVLDGPHMVLQYVKMLEQKP